MSDQKTPIAVTGMALRAPGSETPEVLWANILARLDSLTRPTESQLRRAGVPDRLVDDPNFVRARPLLKEPGGFDAAFFGMSPKEAALTDPAHRLFLTCAWEALERAGVEPGPNAGTVGVFGGSGGGQDSYVIRNFGGAAVDLNDPAVWLPINIGGAPEHFTSRVCFKLDLKGPNVTVMAACATSLVAVHLAVESLRRGECDLALAGGANVMVPHWPGYLYTEGGPVSPSGTIRAFDHKADGTIFGSGVAVVALKRLEDAVADRDPIHGVILGTGVFNDGGQKQTFTAPGTAGQIVAISRAMESAAISAETIGYLEAHGTGTLVGDPIEVEAGSSVFRRDTDEKQYCAMGTVKSNIGHSGSAAGVMGLIKACMALEHQVIPPNIHFETPNPLLKLPETPFYVPTEAEPWDASDHPRRAAVSAFGFGGTNAHIVLEEPPPPPEAEREEREAQVVTLSARTPAALERARHQLTGHLAEHPELHLEDVAYTLRSGRKTFDERAAMVASDLDELQTKLKKGLLHRGRAPVEPRPLVFAFPGQGSQHLRMGLELYRNDTTYQATVDQCAELLTPHLERDIRTLIDSDREDDARRLNQTELAQPALFIVEYALAKSLMAAGVTPTATIGHSIGELVSACLAGVFSLPDALALVALRGQLMQECAPGSMLAVFLPVAEMGSRLIRGVEIAAINAPDVTVVSGPSGAIDKVSEQLEDKGVPFRKLKTSHGFHTQSMEPAIQPFRDAVAQVERAAPSIPFVSNVTGELISDAEAMDAEYWARQIRQPVSFARGVETLAEKEGGVWLEVGPGNALASLVRRQQPDADLLSVMEVGGQSDYGLLEVLTALWAMGAPLEEDLLSPTEGRRRVTLPTYPFERTSHWIEPPLFEADHEPPSPTSLPPKEPEQPLLHVTRWTEQPLRRTLDGREGEGWLIFDDGSGLGAELGEGLRSAGARTISLLAGDRFERLGRDSAVVRPGVEEDLGTILREAEESGWEPKGVLHLWQVTGEKPGLWLDDDYEPWLVTGHYTLASLVTILDELWPEQKVHVAVVADGVTAVDKEDGPIHWQKSLLNGMCRVAPHELPVLTFQLIDIPTAVPSEWMVAAILAEAGTPEPTRLVALREGGRYPEAFEPLTEATSSAGIRPEGVVLITGAMGGLGLETAGRLFDMAQMRLALLSRWQPPPKEEWADRAEVDDRIGYALRKILALEDRGAEVLIVQGDVSEAKDMERVLDEVRAHFGALNGVVHAAGVAAPALVLEADRQKTRQVMDGKVKGAVHLERLLGEAPLDFFISFSSIASTAPVRGQADYSAANSALEALARGSAPKQWSRFCAISWDAWQQVGMAADETTKSDSLMLPELTETPIGDPVEHPLWQYCLRDKLRSAFVGVLSPSEHWVVADHQIQDSPVLPGTGILEMVHAAFRHLHPDDAQAVISHIAFLRLVKVPEDGLEVWLELTREGDSMHFELRSRPVGRGAQQFEDLTLHTTGTIDPLGPEAEPDTAVPSIESLQFELAEDRRSRFGGRWQCSVEEVAEESPMVARYELPVEFESETEQYVLHPALFDCALGHVFRHRLQGRGVPSMIGELRIYGRITPSLVAIARDVPDSGGTVSVLLVDDQNRVVVEAREYLQVLLPEVQESTDAGELRLQVGEAGDLSTLELVPLELPPPQAGEVQIEVHAAGVNFRDVLTALGALPPTEAAKRAMGSECSGRIVAIGEGVEDFSIGDPVVALGPGAFATRTNLASQLVEHKPTVVGFEEAAAVAMTFLTADYALIHQGRLQKGERVLIHSAAGGVGLAAIQIARRAGAEILATAGSEDRRDYLKSLGLEHVMDSHSLGFVDEVRERTDGEGVDVVLNSLAGKFIPASLELLRPFGRFVEIGKRDILDDTQLGLLPFRNNLSLHAVDLGQLIVARHPLIREMLGDVMEALALQQFQAGPLLTLPWQQAQQAFERMTTPQHIGKVVLEVRERSSRDGRVRKEARTSRTGYAWSIPPQQGLDVLQELLQRADLPSHVIVSVRPLELAGGERVTPTLETSEPTERDRPTSQPYRAPSTPVEEKMTEIWKGLLSIGKVGVDDDFFDLGGDSITAIQILSRVRKEFKIGLPHSALLEYPTVALLADLVEQRRGSNEA